MNPATKLCQDRSRTWSRGGRRPEPFAARPPGGKSRRSGHQLCQDRSIWPGESARTGRWCARVRACPRPGRRCLPRGPCGRGSESPVRDVALHRGCLGLGETQTLLLRAPAALLSLWAARVFGAARENVLSLDSFPLCLLWERQSLQLCQ